MQFATIISAFAVALPLASAATIDTRAPLCYGISGTIERFMGSPPGKQIVYAEASFTPTKNGGPMCHFSGKNNLKWRQKDKNRYFESRCSGGTVRVDLEGKWFSYGGVGGIRQDVSHKSQPPNAQGIVVTQFWKNC